MYEKYILARVTGKGDKGTTLPLYLRKALKPAEKKENRELYLALSRLEAGPQPEELPYI